MLLALTVLWGTVGGTVYLFKLVRLGGKSGPEVGLDDAAFAVWRDQRHAQYVWGIAAGWSPLLTSLVVGAIYGAVLRGLLDTWPESVLGAITLTVGVVSCLGPFVFCLRISSRAAARAHVIEAQERAQENVSGN